MANPKILMSQENALIEIWGGGPHLAKSVWVYGEAEHILKVKYVMEDRHMRAEVVDEFVRPEPELDIRVEVYELLEIVLCDLLAKVELSRKSRNLNILCCDVWEEC